MEKSYKMQQNNLVCLFGDMTNVFIEFEEIGIIVKNSYCNLILFVFRCFNVKFVQKSLLIKKCSNFIYNKNMKNSIRANIVVKMYQQEPV